MKLATFDIFDTCLIRKCGKPEVVPHLVALKLWPDDEMIRQEYIIARKQAAQKAGTNATIKDIYSQGVLLCFPNYSSDELMQAEMDMESDMLVANNNPLPIKKLPKPVRKVLHNSFYNSSPLPGDRGSNLSDSITLQTLITLLRQEGWTIKFLSDMYLPSSFLESILIREGFISPLPNGGGEGGEAVIVSCEWGERKDTGRLYKKVRDRLQPEKWIHFGDNQFSDVKQAKKKGIKAIKIKSGYSIAEKSITKLNNTNLNGWQLKFLTGLSRAYRITKGNTPVNILAGDFTAPIFISFVLNLLKQAKEKRIKKLYFLSRDGYIMQKVAESLPHDGIELKYLFVSRRALMRAFLSVDTERRYMQIADRQSLITRSVDHLLWQLQLTRDQLETDFGITFNYTKILNKEQERDFLYKLFHHTYFTPWLLSKFKEDAKITKQYLIQEGFTPESIGKIAMVDIGWLGTTRLMINEIISSNSPLPSNSHNSSNSYNSILTYYLGVREDIYPRFFGDFSSFFNLGQLDTNATSLLENYFCASPYPSTIGYKKIGEAIVPVFPEGKKFKENEVIKANIGSATTIGKWIQQYIEFLDPCILFQWAFFSLEFISKLKGNLDLSPLIIASEFDDGKLVKKLSPKELINIVVFGGRSTAFDFGSLYISTKPKLAQRLWMIKRFSGKIRRYIYKKFIINQ